MDWLDPPAVAGERRAGGKGDGEIHFCSELHGIARLGERRRNGQTAILPDACILEDVKRRRHKMRFNPEMRQRTGDIAEAVAVRTCDAVLDSVHLGAAGRKEKVIPADIVS